MTMLEESQRFKIWFMDSNGNPLGDWLELLPIPLYKGMIVTMHGSSQVFEVVEWSWHHGQDDEKSGLRIVLA